MKRLQILDAGYLKFIESWGSDRRIIEAARMSTDGWFRGWGTDARLLSYLYNNKHSTPFEMGGLVIEVKAPIFVIREWMRHRTQSFNEMSARYIPMPNEHYLPTVDRLLMANEKTGNKQAQGIGLTLTTEAAEDWLDDLCDLYDHSQRVYEKGLSVGVQKEIARLSVLVSRYTKMRASANLRNWLGFLALRQPTNAQDEIRVYANAVAQCIAKKFPRTYGLYIGQEVPVTRAQKWYARARKTWTSLGQGV